MTGFRWLSLLALFLGIGMVATPIPARAQDSNANACPKQPALSRLKRHTIAPGETLTSIARQYNLIPSTLMGMNPELRDGSAPVGTEIVIPPYNGIRVEVPRGTTWQDLANRYNVRADVLYEVNGCQNRPDVAFVPGVNWSPGQPPASDNRTVLSVYPLPSRAETLVRYGWGITPNSSDVVFHAGLDLAASIGTPVLAAGSGTVAYAGDRGSYGKLVVINHQKGKQTRYAQLFSIDVSVGDRVNAGTPLGRVGASGNPDTDEPHLHFEVRYNSDLGWVAENPEPYLSAIAPTSSEAIAARSTEIPPLGRY